ncbi:MAG: IclR family transcriptional regulator [Spirochaetales bacterium]|nr:IclR family transcriptional regulator [Spirochaetales bacterium]
MRTEHTWAPGHTRVRPCRRSAGGAACDRYQAIEMQYLSSVQRALSVLDLFSPENPELSLAEISRQMDVHKSSVLRILATLESAGLLARDKRSGRYRLGLRILELAGRVLSRYDLRSVAAPYMEELARRSGEIVHLAIRDADQIVYLDKKGQGQVLTVATRIGGRHPAYASAMGKVLLADLAPAESAALLGASPLQALTPSTITEPGALGEELARVRSCGYAVDNEEAFPGISCVAAPIRDQSGRVAAAISVTVPTQRMGAARREELRELLVETARAISAQSAGEDMGR